MAESIVRGISLPMLTLSKKMPALNTKYFCFGPIALII